MYVPDLEQAREILGDPAPNWRWGVALPTVSGFVVSKYSAGSGGVSMSANGLLSRPQVPFGKCESIDLAPTQIDMDQRFGAATKLHYPRFHEAQSVTIPIYEDVGYNSSKYLMAWRNEIILENNNYGLPANYKKPITVFGFDITDNNGIAIIIELVDCWPMNPVGGLTYGHAESGFIVVNAEFAVDRQDISFNVIRRRGGRRQATRNSQAGRESGRDNFRDIQRSVRDNRDGGNRQRSIRNQRSQRDDNERNQRRRNG